MTTGCVEYAGATVCFGPAMEVVSEDDRGERWCFTCRQRRPFTLTVTAPVEPSYYGPSFSIHCDRGHDDGDLFPGRIREWSEFDA